MTDLSHIRENIERVRADIASAAQAAGRDPAEITLVAVTKTYPADHVVAAFHAGITDAGENRIQEAVPKIEELAGDLSLSPLRWHLIGHLQTNKAKVAVQNFDLVHSVDSLRLAQAIDRHAGNADRLMSILIQVNTSEEESKFGMAPESTSAAIKEILEGCPHIVIEGFMTMAPLTAPEKARPTFQALRKLRDELAASINHPRFTPRELSMGMSNDYQVAIEEGATMIRIGTAIFGRRDP